MKFTASEIEKYENVIVFDDDSLFAAEEVFIAGPRAALARGAYFRKGEEGIPAEATLFLEKPVDFKENPSAAELLRMPSKKNVVILPIGGELQ